MSYIKSARRPVSRIPARCPFPPVTFEWCRIESQPGNDGERVTFPRIDRDPFAGTAFAVAAKFGRAHGRTDQTRRGERVGNCSGTIVTAIIERFVSSAVSVPLVAKLIGRPDCAFYWKRRILWRGGFPESETRSFT